MLLLTFAAILVVALLAHVTGAMTDANRPRLARALESRAMLGIVFAATFVVIWYSWGQWNPTPLVHDEMAYVLQANIFAQGRWTLPSPVIPAFWEQPHVLVQPVLAAKYFPGHAMMLTPGAMLGWPALMQLGLHGLCAVLLVILVRRVATAPLAFLTWIIWLTSPLTLHFGAGYYSEATTTACWLGGWLALLEWRKTRKPWLLVTVAFLSAWMFITRPLTGVAYVIPVGIVVLRDVILLRRWRELAMSIVVGCAVLSIIPLWSARTTGAWRQTPLVLYTKQYMPYDLPGFGLDSTPPSLELSPQLEHLNMLYRRWHPVHVPSRLPTILSQRVSRLTEGTWAWSKRTLMVFAMLGLLTLGWVTGFAFVGAASLVLTYLIFATPPGWALYYVETVPVYAYLTAAGIAWAIAQLGRPRGVARSDAWRWHAPRWNLAIAGSAVAIAVPGLIAAHLIRGSHQLNQSIQTDFAAMRNAIPADSVLLFVHYAPLHDPNISLVQNSAHLDGERVWTVLDRGPDENARLMALAPRRTAFIYDESQNATFRYDPKRLAAK